MHAYRAAGAIVTPAKTEQRRRDSQRGHAGHERRSREMHRGRATV
jgi:hypothetical protein